MFVIQRKIIQIPIIEQFISVTNLVENGFVMYGDEENDAAEVQDQDQNTETEQLTSTVNKATEIQVQEKNTEIVQSTSTINKATEIQVLGQNTDGLKDVWIQLDQGQ
ncbi:unnamed protein product [Macrosiphum euphorbiae]|uniref:Uncharacterized protein n=2 Tax=Macrosiphum euphorbiae TaxID=13131 RepID=A0AAV0WTF7_9HEMI|nr:unnamed protein product [Macrosiphum euphorbiae]